MAIFALIATAVALPASDSIPKPITTITNDEFIPVMPAPWFSVPYFGDITKIFAPLWKLFPSFEDLGPRIVSDDNKFQVIVQVKEYNKKDLKVKVKGDYIFVQGTHEAKEAGHDLFASQFFHTYTLPSNSSGSDVTAELTSDGYLIVNAPISGKVDRATETDREVTIVDTGAPLKKEIAAPATPEFVEIAERLPEITEKQTTITEKAEVTEISDVSSPSSSTEPEIVSEEDRREPTTPQPDREEITENSNVIPQGDNSLNEVTP